MIAAQDPQEPEYIYEQIVKEIVKKHENLANFKNDQKLEFEVHKLTIETIFNTLKEESRLRTFPVNNLKAYEVGLGKISGRFFDLYIGPIGKQLNMRKIQPLIDKAGRKLSAAISLIPGKSIAELKGSQLDKCLKFITDCRVLLFDLMEYLITIQFEKS